jgi:DUF2948 family protein
MQADDGTENAVRLRAGSVEDLSVIASLVQDAIVPLGDIVFLKEDNSFVMVLNRFRWEDDGEADMRERVHAGLRFDTVQSVRYRNIDTRDRSQFFSLLTLTFDENVVSLHFAGGGAIRLEVETLACALEDLSEPWPTARVPQHDPD